MKVMTVVGTRPELIRLSRVIVRLDACLDHVLVHTGQNHDYELNQIFFDELALRRPDHFLATDPSSLGRMIGTLFIQFEGVLRRERPDALLVLGDTNSALCCVLARRLRIPVFHMEAGNRSFDLNVPEEVNRRLVDHVCDVNLVYTEHARRNLLAEGLPPRQVLLTGSPMLEVLEHYRPLIEASPVLDELGLTPGGYLLASLHREENVDNRRGLEGALAALGAAAREFGRPVLLSTHPRTAKRLQQLGGGALPEGVRTHRPFGFPAYVRLQEGAFCVLSDSGTISEEAALLGFPAVTLRHSMERPEALDGGNIVLCGLEEDVVLRALRLVTDAGAAPGRQVPEAYQVRDVSERVARIITGLTPLLHRWNGIEVQDLQ
ncbi:MAG: UDP-N-acetylglucosamine 2-epimerase (non-hydrolyzing) [bacterium]|jgi:UDP-N-acetylglucosamine 2-epimerase (non-hydrolysing)|nr:UDP-N-acetylglucosamine 2-epimerase (non-hydrolyzing) [bacterium]